MDKKRGISESIEKVSKILGVFLVLGLALFIRLEDLHHWQKHKEYCYYKNEPLVTTLDAYYHLRLARDIIQGNYKAKDEKRGLPDYMARPRVPPLLSVLAAYLSKSSGLSLNWIALLLPPVLGCLVIIPCFLWGKVLGGYLVGFTASLLAVTSYIYYLRTKIGWFDTDILNIFFILIIPYFLLLYCREKDKKRYLYLFLSLVLSSLFIWWWYPARFLIGFLIFIPLLASIFFYKESRIESGIKLVAICTILGFVIFKYHSAWREIILFLSKKQIQTDFPTIAASIAELKRVSIKKVAELSSGHILVFISGLLGWMMLMIKRYKETLFLYIPLFVGLFAFVFSQRFIIFLVPFIAFGLGYIAYLFSQKIEKRPYRPLLYLLLFMVISLSIFPSIRKDWATAFPAKMPATVISGLDYINQTAPPDAFLWCWWDLGYTAQYWANRGTFIDGGGQSPKRGYFAALPLAASDWHLSANIIKFFSHYGEGGFNRLAGKFGQEKAINILKTVLSAPLDKRKKVLKEMNLDPDKWEGFFFPKGKGKVYLVLDGTLPRKAYWWYYFGSWDIKEKSGIHPTIFPIKNCKINNNQITSPTGLRIQLKAGLASYRDRPFFLKELVIYNTETGQIRKRHFFRENGLVFELILPFRIGFLVSEDFYKSVFNRLFILNSYYKGLFRPVFSRYMVVQVWEVL